MCTYFFNRWLQISAVEHNTDGPPGAPQKAVRSHHSHSKVVKQEVQWNGVVWGGVEWSRVGVKHRFLVINAGGIRVEK